MRNETKGKLNWFIVYNVQWMGWFTTIWSLQWRRQPWQLALFAVLFIFSIYFSNFTIVPMVCTDYICNSANMKTNTHSSLENCANRPWRDTKCNCITENNKWKINKKPFILNHWLREAVVFNWFYWRHSNILKWENYQIPTIDDQFTNSNEIVTWDALAMK